MRKILFALFAVLIVHTQAQTVTVLDETTGEPLPGVIIQAGKDKVAVTNADGKADIGTFTGADSIRFSYANYRTAFLPFSKLENGKFKLRLKQNQISLSEVVVSASRWEEDKIETPNRIEKIDMKEVKFQNPQTTADLLGISGYAYIQKSQLGGGSPMIRGMATNRILLVVDGVRMNNAIFRAGNLQNVISIDANALQSAEIFFGPGAVMYGSDAMGGVMNFRTLTPKLADTSGRSALIHGNALARYSSANNEKTAHADVNIGLKKWAFVTSFTRSEYDDLRSGTVGGSNQFYRPAWVKTTSDGDIVMQNSDSALQIGSGYSQNNFMQKVRFAPNRNWDFEYTLNLSETSPYDRYDRLYVMRRGNLRWAEWYYGPQIWHMHRLGVTHSRPTAAYDRLRVVAALQNFEESRHDRELNRTELNSQKETVQALSLNIDLDRRMGEKLTLFYGGEIVHNLVRSNAHVTDIETGASVPAVTRYPDGSTWESAGTYASVKYNITRRIIANAGFRVSQFRVKSEFDTAMFPYPFVRATMNNGSTNGSLGFVFLPHDTWQVYVNASTGFRAPNIDDMGKVFESTPGFVIVPNPGLKPETAYNFELGTAKTIWGLLKLDVTGFYTLLDNAMERKNFQVNGQDSIEYLGSMARVQAVQNMIKARVYGVQAGAQFSYRGVGLLSTISYQRGEEQTPDSLIYYPLRHAAPLFGSVHLTYEIRKLKLDFYTLFNGKMEPGDLALTERVNNSYARNENGEAFVADWYTLNFKAAYYVNRYFGVTAGVENITDQLYRPYSSGINAPGRNFIVSLSARF